MSIGDANCRQLYLSLGCAVENIIVAAEYFGYNTNVVIDKSEKNVAVECNYASSPKIRSNLIFSISKRVINREKYKEKSISNEILSDILLFADKELSITIISDKRTIIELANCALSATSESMSNKMFRSELSKYVIPNKSSAKVGMPGFGLGFPDIISYVAPFMLRTFDLSKLSNIKDEVLLKKFTPHIVVISTKNDDITSWINAGQITQRIFLKLTSENISSSVWAAPIQIGNAYVELQKILKNQFRPQMFFRIGYPTKVIKHSPRLSVNEVLKNE